MIFIRQSINVKDIALLRIQIFLIPNKSVKNLNKLVKRDMKQFNNWSSAIKVSINVGKTELVIF